jgi:thioesterase domain-containing protein
MSVSFDVSVGQLITPLLSGATIVVADDLRTLTGEDFWRLVAEERVTHVNSGHSFIDAVLDEAPPDLALKRLMLGGEPFSLALMRRLRKALPGVDLFNMYGPTETCIDATVYHVTGAETGAIPIGRPLPNYRIYILDERREPVGVCRVGELYIGGPTLARGYLNQPDLTAQRFLDDPFVQGPSLGPQRMYRTGDLARWRGDGQLEFVGRIDTQVKLRGFRIELGEIEAALMADSAVASAAVVVRPIAGPPGSRERLVAYLAPRPGAAPTPADALRRALSRVLPDPMIPQAFVWLKALPVTANAKLDVKALPEPETGEDSVYAEPNGDQERVMQGVWREVLGNSGLGVEDNFFELGGSSLDALRLTAACRTQLGLSLPVTAIFRHQTIRGLVRALESGSLEDADPLLPLQTLGGQPALFCVHPIGGGAHGYAAVARALGHEQPVYGLQALGRAAPASLAAMAGDYVASVRRLQPNGPYRLLGHSFGGLVAFEMARQLEALGETVALLALLDTSIPEPAAQPPASEAQVARLIEAESLGMTTSLDRERAEAAVRGNLRLAAGYAPERVNAPLIYVEALREDEDARAAFWLAASANPWPVVSMPCGHFDMLRAEQAKALAAILGPALVPRSAPRPAQRSGAPRLAPA